MNLYTGICISVHLSPSYLLIICCCMKKWCIIEKDFSNISIENYQLDHHRFNVKNIALIVIEIATRGGGGAGGCPFVGVNAPLLVANVSK